MIIGISVLATRKNILIFDTHEAVHVSSKQNNVHKIFSVRLTRREKKKITISFNSNL